jgi:hypothetical protein
MLDVELLLALLGGKRLGGMECLLKFFSEPVEVHIWSSLMG